MALHDTWAFDPSLAGVNFNVSTNDLSDTDDATNLYANYTGNPGFFYNFGQGASGITPDGWLQLTRGSGGLDYPVMLKQARVLDLSGVTRKFWIGFRTRANYQPTAASTTGRLFWTMTGFNATLATSLVTDADLANVPPAAEAVVEIGIDLDALQYTVIVNNQVIRQTAFAAGLFSTSNYFCVGSGNTAAAVSSIRAFRDFYFLDVDTNNPNRLGAVRTAQAPLASVQNPNALLASGQFNASTVLTNAQAKFGTTSLRGTTTTDGAIFPNNPNIQFPASLTGNNCTVEGWIYLNSTANGGWFMCHKGAAPNGFAIQVYQGYIRVFFDGTSYSGSPNITVAITAGAWIHVAFVKIGPNAYLYLNGVNQASGNSLFSIGVNNSPLYIGNYSGLNAPINGYLDEFRISNIARYSANFTPPAAPFTLDANTVFLCHFEGTTLIDETQSALGSLATSFGNAAPIMAPGVLSSPTNDPITVGMSQPNLIPGSNIVAMDFRDAAQTVAGRVPFHLRLSDGTNQAALPDAYTDPVGKFARRLALRQAAADGGAWTPAKVASNILVLTPDNALQTLALLHFDGTNGAQVSTDDSGHPVTFIGATTALTNVQSRFGNSSVAIGTTAGARAEIADNADLNLTGEFTIESWVYLKNTASVTMAERSAFNAATAQRSWIEFATQQVDVKLFGDAATTNIGVSTAIPIGVWFHFALVYSAFGAYSVYINGVLVGRALSASTWGGTAGPFTIGNNWIGGTGNLPGYVDEFRISNLARYLGFTPPAAAWTADANTVALLHFEGTLGSRVTTDDQGHPVTIVSPGALATPAKFGSASYYGSGPSSGAASVNLGTNADLQLTGDFTLEGWFNPSIYDSSESMLFSKGTGSFLDYYLRTWYVSLGDTNVKLINGVSAPLTPGVWYHIALTRQTTTGTLWINGVPIANFYSALAFGTAAYAMTIGQYNAASGTTNNNALGWHGNIDEVRISNVCRYGVSFTPSKTPFTVDANTVMLMHLDDITDATGRTWTNNGNGAFGTTQVIAGKSYNSGSSGFLSAPMDASLLIPGDFTWECWAYRTAALGDTTIFSVKTANDSTHQITIGQQSDKGLGIYLTDGSGWRSLAPAGALPLNQWVHLAVVCYKGTYIGFINGVPQLTTAAPSTPPGFGLTGGTLSIGGNAANTASQFPGYLDEMRLSNVARYFGAFTPPNAPFVKD